MEGLKKYRLFGEYCDVEIYGTGPAEALSRIKKLPRPQHKEGEKLYGDKTIANLVDTPPLEITEVLGIEDTSSSWRGSTPYIGVLADTPEGIIKIDLAEVNVKIIPMK